MSTPIQALAATGPKQALEPFEYTPGPLGGEEVEIAVESCGICHSDLSMLDNEWGMTAYPFVPGHEIVGRVVRVGAKVTKHKQGDLAGIGCFVDSCRACSSCAAGEEQYCRGHVSFTYNGTERDGVTPTHGGYSSQIVVDESYILKISPKLDLKAVAPLLCAGITTYSPLKHWKVGPASRIAVLGLGGLGHMGVKFGKAFGAHVTVISTSKSKEEDARRLGADAFLLSSDSEATQRAAESFDLILDTVSAEHDLNSVLSMITLDGTLVLVGVPPQAPAIHPFSLIPRRRSIAGSMIGGFRETQEMLDFCAERGIVSDIELIPVSEINNAYTRMIKGDVRYRFVLDLKTL
jgi:uncharacterized zinc-type alcohol dehydrogenase-like protein